MPVRAPHFEIIGARPLGLAFDLVPTVKDFLHLDGLCFPEEAARRLVGLGPGVTFDLDWDELHLRVFNRIEHKEHTEFLIFVSAISAFLVVKFPPPLAFSRIYSVGDELGIVLMGFDPLVQMQASTALQLG